MINIYKHPRFVDVPDHRHNYLELIYMASGSSKHVINNNQPMTLETEDLLFLRPGSSHHIFPSHYDDIAIHFMILPEFFRQPVSLLTEDTYLRRFLNGVLAEDPTTPDYLHFHLQDRLEAQNLLENMTLSLLRHQTNSQLIIQLSMGLLLLELLYMTYKITLGSPSTYEQDLVLQTLNYIENHFADASLTEFSATLKQPAYYISRLMKKYSPYSFSNYVQRRRLQQATRLLVDTTKPVEEIIADVGYDNTSYFHRIFKTKYKMTPKQYRNNFTGTATLPEF